MIGRFYEGQAVSFYLRNAGWVHAIILDILDDDFCYVKFTHPLKENIEMKKVIQMTRLRAGWTTLL